METYPCDVFTERGETSSGAAHSHGPSGERSQRAQVYGALQLEVSLGLSLSLSPSSLPLSFLFTPRLSSSRTDTVFALPSPNSHENTTFCFDFFFVYPTHHHCLLAVILFSSSSVDISTLSTSYTTHQTWPPYRSKCLYHLTRLIYSFSSLKSV